jgi:hypothetical protein
MNTELEDRLRAEMRHATAGARVPPGLARRAWRSRRRRITTRAATAAGTAAVVAAAAVAAGTAGASRDTGIHTTAYVVQHAESALSEAVAANDIMYLRDTDGTQETWFSSGPAGPVSRTEIFSVPGQLVWDIGTNLTTDTVTGVSYGTKTWERSNPRTYPGPPRPYPAPTSCGQVGQPATLTFVLFFTPATLAASIREALACGQYSNEGTQHVDGVDAIKLVSVLSWHAQAETYSITTTLWVDPASYLPLRWTQSLWRQSTKTTGHEVNSLGYDIQWLPPTSANLAQLTVPIPAGFTRTLPGVPMPAVPSFS